MDAHNLGYLQDYSLLIFGAAFIFFLSSYTFLSHDYSPIDEDVSDKIDLSPVPRQIISSIQVRYVRGKSITPLPYDSDYEL